MNGPPEHRTVQTVVYFIGSVAVLLAVGSVTLVAVVLASGRDVSSAGVALIATVTGLTGTCIGSLASMLVSTKSSPTAGDPTTFIAPADATVRVDPAPADPGPTRDEASDIHRTVKKSPARRRRPRGTTS